MVYSTLRDEVITEIGGDISDTVLSANIFSFIKSALRRFPQYTRTRLLIDTSYATLSAGSYYVHPLPSDFIKERAVYYVDNGNRIGIGKISFDDFNEQFNSTATGSPQSGYRVVDNKIEFLRSADKDYTIYIEYFKSVDEVTLADAFFGSSEMIEILKDLVKFYYYQYQEDTTNADRFLGLGKAGLDKLESGFLVDEIPEHIEES